MFFFHDICQELKGRKPWYFNDWYEGLDYKVISSTLFTFFATLGPAVSFGALLNSGTNGELGVSEVLLSTSSVGVAYSIFSGQPLVIVGVTGPISIFCVGVFQLAQNFGIQFIPWLSVITYWSSFMHIAMASFGACSLVRLVTSFSCEVFGALISVLFLSEGIKIIAEAFHNGDGSWSLLFAVGTFTIANILGYARHGILFTAAIRETISDYGAPAAVILFTCLSFTPPVQSSSVPRLQLPPTFTPTNGRGGWLIDPAVTLPPWAWAAAAPPALVLTALIFFDHNVSSLLAQRREFHLRKPPAYNYDFLVVGITMLVPAALGLPCAHGLIPQAPLHVRSLADVRVAPQVDPGSPTAERYRAVRENRLSPLLQSAMVGAALAAGLPALALIPRSVLAGFFAHMALFAARDNPLCRRAVALFSDRLSLAAAAASPPQPHHSDGLRIGPGGSDQVACARDEEGPSHDGALTPTPRSALEGASPSVPCAGDGSGGAAVVGGALESAVSADLHNADGPCHGCPGVCASQWMGRGENMYTAVQLAACGGIYAVTWTPAAVSFPVWIAALVPVRRWLLPRCVDGSVLDRLDWSMVARDMEEDAGDKVNVEEGGETVIAEDEWTDDGIGRQSTISEARSPRTPV